MTGNLIANPSIVLREEFDDWAILYNPNDGEVYGVNPIGVFIWKRLDGKHTMDSLISELRQNCEGIPGNADQEIKKFIEDLEKKGLAGYEA